MTIMKSVAIEEVETVIMIETVDGIFYFSTKLMYNLFIIFLIFSDHNRRYGRSTSGRRYNSTERDRDSDESEDQISGNQFYNRNPSNTIIVLGLQSHITEADVS